MKVKKIGHSVFNWFMGEVSVRPLVLVRVGLGATLGLAYIFLLPSTFFLFGESGMVMPHSVLKWLHSDWASLGIHLLIIFSALQFARSVRPLIWGTVALILHSIIFQSAPFAFWSWAEMIKPFIVYIILFEAIRRAGRPVVTAWPLRLVQLHVCTIYLEAATSRIDKTMWLNGDALLYALWNSKFGRLEADWLPWSSALRPFGMAAFFIELAAPIFLWVPGLGPIWALLLMSFHLGLELFTTVSWWQFMMISLLFSFLITSGTVPPRTPGED